jgi:hypothetical protein
MFSSTDAPTAIGHQEVGTAGLDTVIEALNDQERKGVTLHNVRTWLAS